MPRLPSLEAGRSVPHGCDGSVVFAVYAPFGTDPQLSVYPAPKVQAPIADQALVKELRRVAAAGVNVSALVDLYEDDSWLVEIPAGRPERASIVSAWKQDMAAPQALAGFLRRTHQRFPRSALVLSIEGHGGGFVPDLDLLRITPQSASNWSDGGDSGKLRWVQSEGGSGFEPDPPGSPALPMTSPILPMTSPILPASRLPMSTWAVGAALRSAIAAGVPRPAVINFANCFSASVELLHTVARHADFATGYANYDFFTAGRTYPEVFERLRDQGSAGAGDLAQWFALANAALLAAKKNHPTVGAVVPLARMRRIAKAIDGFAGALTAQLRDPTGRPAAVQSILDAAIAAQHYDTEQGFELAVPDQFVDLGAFAREVGARFAGGPVGTAATALRATLKGLHAYGDFDRPWLDETQIWDFRSPELALNILFPDPAREGRWDWRSPYYLAGKVDPNRPPAQRHVIDFLADRGASSPPWVEFIVEYHRDVPFVGFLPARPPLFPVFDRRYEPKYPHPEGNPPGTTTR